MRLHNLHSTTNNATNVIVRQYPMWLYNKWCESWSGFLIFNVMKDMAICKSWWTNHCKYYIYFICK